MLCAPTVVCEQYFQKGHSVSNLFAVITLRASLEYRRGHQPCPLGSHLEVCVACQYKVTQARGCYNKAQRKAKLSWVPKLN